MGKFFDFLKKKQPQQSSFVQQQLVPQQPQQQEIPQYDGANAIQYFSQLMGPTPAEREAQERKLLENKRKMIAWTGFFDGIRQLGNLYYASKGATPQQYTDKPYHQIEQNYSQERQLQDYLQRNRQAYAKQLFDWQQKISDTERRNKIANAQAKYYDTRDEMAQQKAELDKMKAVRVIKQKDGSLMKFDPVSGTIEPLTEADPLYVEWMNTQIADKKAKTNKTLSNMGGGSSGNKDGYETIVEEYIDDRTGRKVKKTVKQPRNSKGSGRDYSKFIKGKSGNSQASEEDWEIYRTK